ncbi:hypothetical protein CMUS01_08436 [Colletotrichum musicola]|uniref:Uncharacterized protein n=1 Tax=Colletotrichum musicola TaxID=2175873 RepID=A0A8H6NDE5_9PEZI|nr:hypothetical protein CMUS01_08436 [Colletotrichum musicola]
MRAAPGCEPASDTAQIIESIRSSIILCLSHMFSLHYRTIGINAQVSGRTTDGKLSLIGIQLRPMDLQRAAWDEMAPSAETCNHGGGRQRDNIDQESSRRLAQGWPWHEPHGISDQDRQSEVDTSLAALRKGGSGHLGGWSEMRDFITSHRRPPASVASQSFHMAAMQALNRMGKRSPLRIWERCFREHLASAVICAERDQQGQQADDVGISEGRKGRKPGLLSPELARFLPFEQALQAYAREPGPETLNRTRLKKRSSSPAYCAALQRLRNGPDSASSSLSCHLRRRRQVSNNARTQLVSVDPIDRVPAPAAQCPPSRRNSITRSGAVGGVWGSATHDSPAGRFASHLSLVN